MRNLRSCGRTFVLGAIAPAASTTPAMYLPPSFAVSDEQTLNSFVERYEFATLVSGSGSGLVASHLPMTLRRQEGKAVLVGHLARANHHWKRLDGSGEALAIFQGPHAYVSPTWYRTSPAVPTWNYAALHVYGKPRAIEDRGFTTAALESLVARHESGRGNQWCMEDLPAELYERLAAAIVAFEMPVERFEGKFKLGQNRTREDQAGMLLGLASEGTPGAEALAEFIKEHLGFRESSG